jgi:serine/threonine protein kinase
MDGGRYLGSGTYGCVFTPPLLCKSQKHTPKSAVGKITIKMDGIQEIEAANAIRKIPLATNYFVLPEPESCEPLPLNKQTEKKDELDLCFAPGRTALEYKNAIQIFEPFGGVLPFYKVLESSDLGPKRFDFFAFFRHMLEAGSTLLISGVCHYDLHPGNILVDGKGVARILDFGMSFTKDSIRDSLLENRWKVQMFGQENQISPHILNSEPPEITIMTAVREGKMSFNDALRNTVLGKPVFRSLEKILGQSRVSSAEDMRSFWMTSQACQEEDWVRFWQLYWPGYDGWAIGAIALSLIQILMMNPEFTTSNPWKERQWAVKAALKGLLHPSPRKRIDCMEALAVFDPENVWIRRFGGQWLEERKKQRAQI